MGAPHQPYEASPSAELLVLPASPPLVSPFLRVLVGIRRILWLLVALAEVLLIARVIAMAVVGAPVLGHTLILQVIEELYRVTGVGVNRFHRFADMPGKGPHLLDVAALLAMEITFFSALALSSIVHWLECVVQRFTSGESAALRVEQ